jgi:hypothetical protein
MLPVSFSDSQIEEVRNMGYLVPRQLRARYLERLVALLPRDHGDADVRRACVLAQREVLVSGVAQCPLTPIAAFRAQGRLCHLSARFGLMRCSETPTLTRFPGPGRNGPYRISAA